MTVTILSALAVLLALTGQTYSTPSDQACARESPFDVALLAVQYAPSVCASKECKRYANEFTIHGMWPNYMNNSYPENCCFQPYLNKEVLKPILPRMAKSWRNLLADSNDYGFWIHEWRKHGTCAASSKLRGQLNYFKTALDLFEDLEITKWLSDAGIKPSRSLAGVSVEKVREAIRKGFGKRPQINCFRGNQLPALGEIYFCYDPMTLNPIDCPAETRNSCRSRTGDLTIPSV